jgi:hypothetical protein
MGLIVDAVPDVLNIPNADVQATGDFGSDVDARFIDGMAKAGEKLVGGVASHRAERAANRASHRSVRWTAVQLARTESPVRRQSGAQRIHGPRKAHPPPAVYCPPLRRHSAVRSASRAAQAVVIACRSAGDTEQLAKAAPRAKIRSAMLVVRIGVSLPGAGRRCERARPTQEGQRPATSVR